VNRSREDKNASVDPVAVESEVLKTRDVECSKEVREASSVRSSSM
jgi:hypothetical protein